jgi:hypothetical protein
MDNRIKLLESQFQSLILKIDASASIRDRLLTSEAGLSGTQALGTTVSPCDPRNQSTRSTAIRKWGWLKVKWPITETPVKVTMQKLCTNLEPRYSVGESASPEESSVDLEKSTWKTKVWRRSDLLSNRLIQWRLGHKNIRFTRNPRIRQQCFEDLAKSWRWFSPKLFG